jgi:hypothetical protein
MKTQAEVTAAVEGPITGGTHGWPFAASLRDVAALGYQEGRVLSRRHREALP